MIGRFLTFAMLAGTMILPIGCATKKFVREELQKSDARVEQQFGKLGTDLDQDRSRLGAVASQVTEARSVADEATRRAEQAGATADRAAARSDEAAGVAGQAVTKAGETDTRLTRLWTNRNKRQLMDTVVVTFGFDKWELTDGAQTRLLDVVKELRENPNAVVDIEGYTDSMGPVGYNLQLSERRAEAVRRFLVQNGVELQRIQSIGLGIARPAANAKTTRPAAQDRRVAVRLSIPVE